MFIKKCLTLHRILDIISLFAGMAELADALDLGSSGRPCRFKSCCPYYLQGFQRFYHLLKSLFFTLFNYFFYTFLFYCIFLYVILFICINFLPFRKSVPTVYKLIFIRFPLFLYVFP